MNTNFSAPTWNINGVSSFVGERTSSLPKGLIQNASAANSYANQQQTLGAGR